VNTQLFRLNEERDWLTREYSWFNQLTRLATPHLKDFFILDLFNKFLESLGALSLLASGNKPL